MCYHKGYGSNNNNYSLSDKHMTHRLVRMYQVDIGGIMERKLEKNPNFSWGRQHTNQTQNVYRSHHLCNIRTKERGKMKGGPLRLLQIELTTKAKVKVITLRSGKELKKFQQTKKVVPPKDEIPIMEAITNVVNEGKNVNVPFPQRLEDERKDKEFARFLEISGKLHINIPFIDVITQMPNFVKFKKKYNV
ncbi:hypothetical protein CR513_39381, partial [Mucuna pruriens]